MLHTVTHYIPMMYQYMGHHSCVYNIICCNVWEGTQRNMEGGNIHNIGNTLGDCPRIGFGDPPPPPENVQNSNTVQRQSKLCKTISLGNGYIGFPYYPLVRPKRHGTACAIGPEGEARTHGPRASSVPKAK